jgi:hypothetical protein
MVTAKAVTAETLWRVTRGGLDMALTPYGL